MIEHKSPISGIASYANRYIATAGYDNQVILWDASKKEAISRGVHDHLANQCQFSLDGKYLLSSSSDYTVRLWTIPDMRLVSVFKDHTDDVEMATFHPTLNYVATASRDHKVRVYHFDGRLIATFEGHRSDVLSVEWVNHTNDIVSSGDDGTIRKWSLEKMSQIEKYDLDGVETDTVVISSIGTIYAGTDDGEIVSFSPSGKKITQAHQSGIKKLVYSKDTNHIASISYDRKVKIWKIDNDLNLNLAYESVIPWIIWARSASFKGTSELVFGTFGSSYGSFLFKENRWDVSKINYTSGINHISKFQEKYIYVGDSGEVFCDYEKILEVPSLLNFSLGTDVNLVCGGQSGTLFNCLNGKVIHQFKSPLNCISKTKVGFVVGTYTGEVLFFEEQGSQIIFVNEKKLHTNAIKSIAVVDQVLFSVCATGDALVYDLSKDKITQFIPRAHQKIANSCSSIKNTHFLSVGRDLILRIWDLQGNLVDAIFSPHNHSIKCVAGSGINSFIATCSYDGKIAIYNMDKKDWILIKKVTSSGISSVFFDKKQFIVSSYDGNSYSISLDEVQ